MSIKIIIALCAITAVMGYPSWYPKENAFEDLYQEDINEAFKLDDFVLSRAKREFELNGGGGGSPAQGIDLSLQGTAPVWQSDNGRHEVDVSGSYSQHLGGPYGNSDPNWGAGATYTFRF